MPRHMTPSSAEHLQSQKSSRRKFTPVRWPNGCIFMVISVWVWLACCQQSDFSTSSNNIRASEIHSHYDIEYLNESQIELGTRLGHGRFSNVYEGVLNGSIPVAAKVLKPIEKWRLQREIEFMEMLQGEPNVIKLFGVYGDEFSPVIVTERIKQSNRTVLSYEELRWVMRELLRTLNGTHYHNVFHRDVKWQNMLVSFEERKMRLIDWGLAEYVVLDQEYSPSVGTKSYKAPELLMEWRHYGPGVDIWAAGIVMANLMYGCPSFFSAAENEGVLVRQTKLFGKNRMMKLARRYKYKRPLAYTTTQSLLEYALPHTRHLFTHESLDFLQLLLVPEPEDRASAAEALLHPFVRDV